MLRTFGCIGVYRPEITIVDYMAVYWAGSTLGALAAWFATPLARKIAKTVAKLANLCASKVNRTKMMREDAEEEDSVPLVGDGDAAAASFFVIGGEDDGVAGDAADDEISNVTEDSHEHKL